MWVHPHSGVGRGTNVADIRATRTLWYGLPLMDGYKGSYNAEPNNPFTRYHQITKKTATTSRAAKPQTKKKQMRPSPSPHSASDSPSATRPHVAKKRACPTLVNDIDSDIQEQPPKKRTHTVTVEEVPDED